MRQIGILGGGQLGMLLAQSIHTLGGTVVIYDPDPQAPACKQVPVAYNSSWTNVLALEKFFADCDAVTYEFENVESASLYAFEKNKPILPGVRVLRTTQDRLLEKTFIKDAGLPVVDFAVVKSLEELPEIARKFGGFPILLKTVRGGYDGKGQVLLTNMDEVEAYKLGQEAIADSLWAVLERVVPLEKEVSCIVARSPSGEEVTFPLMENMHRNQILDMTLLPARVPASVEAKVKEIALAAARALEVYGLLTTEFFLSRQPVENSNGVECDGWHIYINEFAPRPHNSGHVTRKACSLSQFDALARILLSVPLTQPKIIAPGAFCMANLLGEVWLSQNTTDLDLSTMSKFPDVIDVVIYGKEEPRAKRKMGHFVTHGQTADEALNTARAFRDSLMRTPPAQAEAPAKPAEKTQPKSR